MREPVAALTCRGQALRMGEAGADLPTASMVTHRLVGDRAKLGVLENPCGKSHAVRLDKTGSGAGESHARAPQKKKTAPEVGLPGEGSEPSTARCAPRAWERTLSRPRARARARRSDGQAPVPLVVCEGSGVRRCERRSRAWRPRVGSLRGPARMLRNGDSGRPLCMSTVIRHVKANFGSRLLHRPLIVHVAQYTLWNTPER